MKNDRLWVATGNNMVLGGDMDRRVVWVTIDPGVERPEDRDDFTIKDLAAHVARNRVPVLADLLTMLSAWDAAGRRSDPPPTSDCFGAWIAAIRGVLADLESGMPNRTPRCKSQIAAPSDRLTRGRRG